MGTEFDQDEIDVAKLRERLRQMNDTELRSFGRDALYMTSETGRESLVGRVKAPERTAAMLSGFLILRRFCDPPEHLGDNFPFLFAAERNRFVVRILGLKHNRMVIVL
jgi:hypothetical protein